MGLINLETNERKNLALWMMFGGCLVFTIYACVGLWLVSSSLNYVFWLAVIAHVQIFSIMAGFIAQLVKRRLSVTRDGVSITDEGVAGHEQKPCDKEEKDEDGLPPFNPKEMI